jgi:hypothetical protein
MTKQGSVHIQIPIRTQLFYDDRLVDPFPTLCLLILNIGPMIRGGLKNQIEDYINNNKSICSCTNLPCLMLIIDDLEITYLSVDNNGNIDNAGGPQILGRCSDLCQLLKIRAMNRSIVNINRPGAGQISFQPALGYVFLIDATHIQMPANWQTSKVLDADEIATPRLPGVNTVPTVPAGASTSLWTK